MDRRVTTATIARNQHARHTRHVTALPGAPALTTVPGRRWRDLHAHYADRLGPRATDEQVRLLLGSLITHTLEMERLQATAARGEPVDLTAVIQGTQTVLRLLAELGLTTKPGDAPEPTLEEYVTCAR